MQDTALQGASTSVEQQAQQQAEAPAQQQRGLQFSDRDEHIYFWFPLLAGLSELTFDPRQDIRSSALGVSLCTLPVKLAHTTASGLSCSCRLVQEGVSRTSSSVQVAC